MNNSIIYVPSSSAFLNMHIPIDIDEMIKVLEQEIVWQKQKPTDEPLE